MMIIIIHDECWIKWIHFHGSGPIGLHRKNTKWRISQKRGQFGRHKWQFCILLFIPVILVCHKPWFANVLLWPTFWPLPIFDLVGQTEVKRSYIELGHQSLYSYQIWKQLLYWFLRYAKLCVCYIWWPSFQGQWSRSILTTWYKCIMGLNILIHHRTIGIDAILK